MVITGADDAAQLVVDEEEAILDAGVVEHQKKMAATMAATNSASQVTDDLELDLPTLPPKNLPAAKPTAPVVPMSPLPPKSAVVSVAPAVVPRLSQPPVTRVEPNLKPPTAVYRHDRLPSQQKAPVLPPRPPATSQNHGLGAPNFGGLTESQKKRRRRKKKPASGMQFDLSQSALRGSNVVLGDPAQRGVSLNTLRTASPATNNIPDRFDIGEIPTAQVVTQAPVLPPSLTSNPTTLSVPPTPPTAQAPKPIPPNTVIRIE